MYFTNGNYVMGGNFKIKKAAPIDDRGTVAKKIDLQNPNLFDGFTYNGMIVSVVDDTINNGLYRLEDKSTLTWKKEGSGTTDLSDYYTKPQVDGLLDSISLDDYYTKTQTDVLLSDKVEKVTGKGLSTNDFTDTFKQALELKKVQGISTDSVTKKLVVNYTDSTVANLNINDIVTDIQVSGATLNATTNVLTLTSTDGGADVTVDLSDFVNSGELTSALSGKADKIHSHSTSDILGLDAILSNKVTKNEAIIGATKTKITYDINGLVVNGADLSTSDIPNLPQSKIINLETNLSSKVDKVAGKGLSTEDFTTAEKTKLTGLSNYTKPVSEPISYITGLQTALDSKVSKTGVETLHSTDALRISGTTLSLYKGDGTFESVVTQDTVYTLPKASATVLGGIKVGTNLSIDANGVLSANDTNVSFTEISNKPTNLSGYGITDAYTKTQVDSLIPNISTKQDTLVSATNIKTINGESVLGSGDIVITGGGSVQLTGNQTIAGIKTFSSNIVGNVIGNLSGNATSATSATKLTTPRQINGVNFDGSANITVVDSTKVSLTGNETIAGTKTFSSTIAGNITGNAGTATKLATARTIGGVSFDGTANINLPGVNAAGNQNTTGNAGSATKLATARTINGVAFDGSANITVSDDTKLTKTNPSIIGSITEQVYNLTGTVINPTNGTIQYKTVSSNTTFTETLISGQSVLLRLINATSYTITFPTITWVGADAPILTANCAIALWKEQSTLYGAYIGTLVW